LAFQRRQPGGGDTRAGAGEKEDDKGEQSRQGQFLAGLRPAIRVRIDTGFIFAPCRHIPQPIVALKEAELMSIRRIKVGPRMSQAVIHGDAVYLAGQVATENAGRSVTEQTREILAKIDELLGEAGTDRTRLLQASVFLADIAGFAEMNAVWEAWVSAGDTPARTTIEARLASPNYAVEIAVIAAI
jgi:enamine deaminase RidA (YjgF/YER057c/UK114 family)